MTMNAGLCYPWTGRILGALVIAYPPSRILEIAS
jgi:hypothetical protein